MPTLPSSPMSGVFQFTPIRQVLSSRAVRRIRRNGLSQEMNEIDAEKRSRAKIEQELQNVKNELTIVRERAAEAAKKNSDSAEYLARIQELEEEVVELKREKFEEVSATDMAHIPDHDGLDFSIHRSMAMNNDDGPDLPETLRADDDYYQAYFPEREISPSTAETGTQTNMGVSEIDVINDYKMRQTSYLVEARMELERLFPGETSIGFEIDNANPKPLLDALLDRLHAVKGLLAKTRHELSTAQTLQGNMSGQFRIMLDQLHSARNRVEEVQVEHRTTISQYQKAVRKGNDLEVDMMERDNTIKKLTSTLESYREEIFELETLITNLEAEHAGTLKRKQQDMDDTVADLECHVAAETQGRREAEAEAEQHLLRVKEMENLVAELRNAINEKQLLLRDLEHQKQLDFEEREMEIGSMNAKVSDMASVIVGYELDITELETQKADLVKQLNDQKQGRLRATEEMKAAMKRAVDTIDAIGKAHAKDAQTPLGVPFGPIRNNGLLTPDSAIKFSDSDKIPGYVQVDRGKARKERRIDSGIYLPELEEGDEEMAELLNNMPSSDMPGSEL